MKDKSLNYFFKDKDFMQGDQFFHIFLQLSSKLYILNVFRVFKLFLQHSIQILFDVIFCKNVIFFVANLVML